MNEPWTFVDRYPALKYSLFESIRFSTHELKEEDGTLTFTGTLLLDGPLQAAGRFLDNRPTVTLAGGIDEVGEGDATMPEMTLTSDITGNVSLGSFSFAIGIEVVNDVIINDKGKPLAGPEVNLLTTIAIPGHDDLVVKAAMGANMFQVTFTAEIPADLELGLPLLNRLADNTPVAALLPTQLPLVSDLILTGWSIGVAPGETLPKLTSVSVSVATRESFTWELIPDLLTVEQLGFSIDVILTDSGSERYAALSAVIGLSRNPDVFLELGAAYPDYVINGSFTPSEPPDLSQLGIQPSQLTAADDCIDLRALAVKFLGATVGDTLPKLDVCALRFEFDPKNSAFSLDGYLDSDWTIIEVGGKAVITLTNITFMLRHLARLTTGAIGASFRLADPETGPEISVSGAYGGAEAGGQLASPELSLRDLITFYFPDAKLPPGDVVLNKLSAELSTGAAKPYSFAIAATWTDIFGGAVPLKSVGAAVTISSEIKNEVRQTKGRIEGALDFGGFTMIGGFSFDSENDNSIDLTLFDITAKINTKNPPYILTISPKGLSFGDVVELLVSAALGGRRVALPSPWDVLNLISLDGLDFFVNFTDEKVGFTLDLDLNLGFISLKKIALNYDIKAKTVVFTIEDGSFLGGAAPLPEPWDVTDPANAPAVPGEGSDIFKLKLLAAGQHVLPSSGDLPASVGQSLDILKQAFKVPAQTPPLQGTELVFSNEAGWLVGMRATIIGIIDLDAVFYDPLLYGVGIGVTGGNFNNLRFEVLYKKVSDTIGVYQIDLTLPDFIRNQDFGTFSVTLPSIKLAIYTNGNFLLDLGFPTNSDFTRSFSLQWLPFVGSGGFYYGQLNGETATGLPATDCGDFNPAIAFGVGVRVGVGKEINKGILKAGLSLTVQGIMEGLIAPYHPYSGTNLITHGSNPSALASSGPDTYYFVQGQIAIVGRIYGEVNFAIISAELDITARIAVRLVLEAAKAILIAFEAGVSVKLRVTVNLGLFKIKVNLSFSTTVRADFTIGADDPNPPWLQCGSPAPAVLRRLTTPLDQLGAPCIVPEMAFVPIAPESPVPMRMYYLPQFSVSSDSGETSGAGVALLYIDAVDPEQLVPRAAAEPRSFEKLAEGLLLWTINAYLQLDDPSVENILSQELGAGDLEQIACYFERSSNDVPLQPFDSATALDFLANYAAVNLDIPQPNDDGSDAADFPNASLFPMLPIFSLTVGEGTPIDFASFNQVDDAYLSKIKAYFQQLRARFRRESQADAEAHFDDLANETQSLVAFMFVDYLSMLIRALVEDAHDVFRATAVRLDADTSLTDLVVRFPEANLTPEAWGFHNRQRPLRPGSQLLVRELDARVHLGDTHAAIAARFGLADDALAGIALPPPGRTVRLPAHSITARQGDTLLALANRAGVPVAQLIRNNLEKPLFAAGTPIIIRGAAAMTVADIVGQLRATQRFENLSGMAARIYLSGLRPPAPPETTGGDLGDLAPLYQLSGQQFPASDLAAGTPITLGLTSGGPLSWLKFGPDYGVSTQGGEDKTDIRFGLTAEVTALIAGLTRAAASFDPQSSFQTFDLFDLQARRITMRSPIAWMRPDALTVEDDPLDPGIWIFPPELIEIITDTDRSDAKFELVREVDGEEQPVAPVWTTLIPIDIRLAPSGMTGEAVRNVYELQGADDQGARLLEQLLIRAASNPGLTADIQLLYPPEPIVPGDEQLPVGLRSDGAENTSLFLLQTNLSTVSNPETTLTAVELMRAGSNLIGMTGIELAKLVWEASVVRSGGYYLYYQVTDSGAGLPDDLFNESPTTRVYLLISTPIESDGQGTLLPPFLNAVTTQEQVDPQNELLFVRSVPQTMRHMVMAPDETLAQLARRTHVDPGAIARANALCRLNNEVTLTIPPRPEIRGNAVAWTEPCSHQPVTDTTLVAVAATHGVSVTALAFANADVPGLWLDRLSFDDQIQVKVPQIPPGNVGLALERTNPDTIGDPDARQLAELFNWLNVRTAAFGVFPQSNPALPLGPSEPDDNAAFHPDADTRPPVPQASATWIYSGVLPVFLETDDGTGVLDPVNDPYATVGETVRFDLSWLDMFGNTIPLANRGDFQHDVEIRYIDTLVGLDAWPNVIARYVVEPPATTGADPQLVATLSFVADRYEAGPQRDPVQQARSDRDQFATIFYQVKQDDVRLTLTTSLESTATAEVDFKPQLLAWIQQIVDVLTGIIDNGPPPEPPKPLVLTLARDVTADNPKNIFALAVELGITRDINLVDDQLKDVPAASHAVSVVAPDIQQPSDTSRAAPVPPLRAFADAVESAFPQLKVLTGSRQADDDQQVAVDIWVARFGAGPIPGIQLAVDVARPFFFAPRPLATSLLSRADADHEDPVPIYPYVSGEFIGDQTPSPRIVTGIDVESVARDFVAAVDDFLAADLSVPAWLLESTPLPGRVAPGGRVSSRPGQPDPLTQPFETIIDAKANIADAVAADAIAILQQPKPADSNLANAREQWRQQLLLQLANAYRIDVGIQYDVVVTADAPPADRRPPRLFGKVVPPAGEQGEGDRAFSFNASRIPLDSTAGPVFLNTMLDVRQAKAQRNLRVNLNLQLTQIERDIRDVPQIEGYQSSTWLTFVNPFTVTGDGVPLLSPTIPIPLRAYPTPPSLTEQQGIPEVKQFTRRRGALADAEGNALDKARAWSYGFTYEGVEADQDSVYAVVTLNVNQNEANAFADPDDPDLLEALVQFAAVYPEVADDLEQVRAGDDNPVARNALTSFAWLVQRAGNAWLQWREAQDALAAARAAPNRETTFRVRENGQGEDPLTVVVSRVSETGPAITFPVIEIQGYTAIAHDHEDGVAYTYEDPAGSTLTAEAGKAISKRRALVGGFDVLKEENAWAGIFIVRNEDLVDSAPTVSEFLYQTPRIRFIDPLTPLLDPDIEVPIGPFTPGDERRPLVTFLTNFFDVFFEGAVSPGEQRTLAMGAAYSFGLGRDPGAQSGLRVDNPILMTPPQPFPVNESGADNAFLEAVSARITSWLQRNEPRGVTTDGKLRLDLTVYASLADSKLPVLRLRNLTLETKRLNLD
jgi:LysM repeat protein